MKFCSDTIVITTHAADVLPSDEVRKALNRHFCGDWGELCKFDWQQNEDALLFGDRRFFSAYRIESGIKFWIITEWDRSVTTVLMPEDY